METDIDLRFAIVDNDGRRRYPRKAMNEKTGAYGFVVGRRLKEEPETVQTIEEVIQGVVFDGKRLRTSVFPATSGNRYNGKGLYKPCRALGYVIAPELAHLVNGAPLKPLDEPVRR